MACAGPSNLSSRWATKLATNLNILYTQQKLCDCTITTNYDGKTTSIECHRVVLAAASGYLAEQLMNDGCNTDINIVNVDNVDPQVLSQVVEYLYTGDCGDADTYTNELLQVGNTWGVGELVNDCLKQQVDCLNNECCVKYLEMGIKHDVDTETLEPIIRYLWMHFEELYETGMLNQLSVDGWSTLLSLRKQEDGAAQENTVFDALAKWSGENPTLSADSLLPLIKYENMNNDYLVSVVMYHNIISLAQREALSKVILQKMEKSGSEASNISVGQDMDDKEAKARVKQLVRITSGHELEVFDSISEEWQHFTYVPDWVSDLTATCVFKQQIVFVGSTAKTGQNNKCFILTMDDFQAPQLLPDLPCAITYASVVHTGKEIYITGGASSQDEMFCIDVTVRPRLWGWKECTPLLYKVHKHESWYYDGHIYISGGSTRNTHKYNITTTRWSQCADCPVDINAYDYRGLQDGCEMHFFLCDHRVTYNSDLDEWLTQEYSNKRIDLFKAIPVFCNGEIKVAVPGTSVNIFSYNDDDHSWNARSIDADEMLSIRHFYAA